MALYYDDNFGSWSDMSDSDMREFYFKTQQESVLKKCVDCGRTVRIKPEYECCNSCADIREGLGGY